MADRARARRPRVRLGPGLEQPAYRHVICAISLGTPRLLRIVRRRADDHGGTYEAPDDRHWQVLLPDVHTVRAHRQCDIDVVVHNECHSLLPAEEGE